MPRWPLRIILVREEEGGFIVWGGAQRGLSVNPRIANAREHATQGAAELDARQRAADSGVRVVEMMVIDGHEVEGVPVLVAGRHRLEAAKRLGWSHIDCIEVDDDAIGAELWEIAENLHRLDLTKEQRDEHIRRYAELLEARLAAERQGAQSEHPVLSDGRGAGPQHEKGIALRIAEETGLSRSTVKRGPPVLRGRLSLPDFSPDGEAA